MSEFILFDQVLEEYKKIKISDDDNVSTDSEDLSGKTISCSHENIINEKGTSVCVDCGEEIQYESTHDKEWRYYGQGDTKHVSDPNRVQMRKSEERSIFKDVENLGFSDNIVAKANKIYAQVTQGKIFRGNSRRAIVFACIFHAYKVSGKPQSHERLIKIFNLNRKTGLKGLKYVNLYAPKDSKIRTTYISPINLVEEILEQFSATKEQKQEVIELYEKIKNKSSRLNRSRPQSVSSGLVFYWTCLKGKNISLKDFAKKVMLSELTINKIAKEIAEVLCTPGVV
jgi:transcription initiation factor TFIIIB Brf1 subunit/transcription initiation factor TFIIB